jgi:hypothetical protein
MKRARGDAFLRAFARLALLSSFIFLVADNRCSTVVAAREIRWKKIFRVAFHALASSCERGDGNNPGES